MLRPTKKERFSLAYVAAVAAHSGFQLDEPKVDFDSIDGELKADEGRRPRLEFQVKATSREVLKEGHLAFPLPLKNYNDLRVEVIVPRILIVVLLPDDEAEWVTHCEDELCMRRCAYWLSLRGMPDVENRESVTVHLPRAQVFDSGQLIGLMERIEQGDQL